MAKINVSLPDELLAEVDEIARERRCSRSGLVAEATARYVTGLAEERAAREREAQIRQAMANMAELGKNVPPGGAPAVEIIRRDRDGNWGHPERLGDPE